MTVQIGEYEWAIILVDPDDEQLLMPTGYTIGVTDLYFGAIFIANNLDDELFYKCLVHELCHAMVFSYGLRFSVPDEECVCQVIELFSDEIDALADGIYAKLRG